MASLGKIWRRWKLPRGVFGIEQEKSLRDLEEVVGRHQDALEFGPIPGSYFYMSWHVAGTITSGPNKQRYPVKGIGSMTPIYAAGVTSTAGPTADINWVIVDIDGSAATLLESDLTINENSASVSGNASFHTKRLDNAAYLRLDVNKITGTPSRVDALIVFQYVPRIGGA